jgi:hypothetical protein
LITQRELSAHAIPSLFLAAVGAVPFLVLYIVMLEMRERRQVEHALAAARAEARAEAERLARARSDFRQHEPRDPHPLNAILGLAQTGERDLSGRQAKQQFARISDSGQHLLGIINDILDCAKIDAGKLSVEHIAIEPEQIIDNVVTLTAERAFERGLRFEVRERPAGPLPGRSFAHLSGAHQPARQRHQVLEHGSVTLDARVEGDMQLRVSDTGVGMSRTKSPACSNPSNRPTAPPPAVSAAPASACRSAPTSFRPWAAASTSSARPVWGAALKYGCRSSTQIRRPAHPSCAHRPGRLPVSGIHPIVADLIAAAIGPARSTRRRHTARRRPDRDRRPPRYRGPVLARLAEPPALEPAPSPSPDASKKSTGQTCPMQSTDTFR